MKIISEKSLGHVWIKCLIEILENGKLISDNADRLQELTYFIVELSNIEEDEIIKKFADNSRIELMKKKYCTCGLVGDYKVDYGSYIFNNGGINQIDWAINKLKNKPETKSATITLHKPGEDMLSCLSLLDFKIRENKLFMSAVYRSQNAYSSMPGNMLALRHIQGDVAKAVEVPIGPIELFVMSSHIYEKDFAKTKEIINEYRKL